MEIEGMIISDLGMLEGISKAGNPWKKHEWLLETTGQYPRKIKFTVFGERVNTINFELGKSYVIQVDVESREFNGRWYTDLTAYSYRPVEGGLQGGVQSPVLGGSQPSNPYTQPQFAQPEAPKANPFATPEQDFSSDDSQEDLPF